LARIVLAAMFAEVCSAFRRGLNSRRPANHCLEDRLFRPDALVLGGSSVQVTSNALV